MGDAQPGGLFARGDGRGQLRRVGLEIDDIDLVVRHLLQRVALLDDIHRIRDQRHRAGGVDVEIHWRPDDRILQRQAGDDLGAFGIGKINQQDLVLAGCGQDGLSIVIP